MRRELDRAPGVGREPLPGVTRGPEVLAGEFEDAEPALDQLDGRLEQVMVDRDGQQVHRAVVRGRHQGHPARDQIAQQTGDQRRADRPARRAIGSSADRRAAGPRAGVPARWPCYALVTEVAGDRGRTSCRLAPRSPRELAAELCRSLGAGEPERAAAGLASPCEGLVFDRVIVAGSLDSSEAGNAASGQRLAAAAAAYLRGFLVE